MSESTIDCSCEHSINYKAVKPSAVYKDECVYCFSTNPLFICLNCYLGFCSSHFELHLKKTSHCLAIEQKEKKASVALRDESNPKIYKFDEAESSFEYKFSCFSCKNFNLQENSALKESLNFISNSMSAKEKAESSSWQEKTVKCSHLENLKQEARTLVGSTCDSCDIKENLWMCLVCASKGCGRKQFDGKGGNGHGINHFELTGHEASVKLGTITPEGSADVFCYKCDESRLDPNLKNHLKSFGFKIEETNKTEKSLLELQLEMNQQFDFSMKSLDGQDLEPRIGKGFKGFKNLGNSCYLSSALQSLIHFKEFQTKFQDSHFIDCSFNPTKCLNCQLTKILIESENQIVPWMFKTLISKDHFDFSSPRQQDSFEFLQHFLKNFKEFSNLFEFALEQKIVCLQCKEKSVTILSFESLVLRLCKGEPGFSLQASLDSFFDKDLVDCKCEKCGNLKAEKSFSFISFSKYLIIQLNKFVVDNFVPKKLQDQVQVDLDLDLNKFKAQAFDEDFTEETVNSSVKEQLIMMGFDEIQIINAFKATGKNDAELLMNTILEGSCNEYNDQDSVSLLIDAGFSQVQAKRALKISKGDLEKALESLLSSLGPNYSLKSFITHKGTSVNCGHYIAHVKQGDEWIMYNDEKVAVDPNPCFNDAYVLIYENTSTYSSFE